MFLTLLLVTFAIAVAVSFVVARAFDKPIGAILTRIIADEISAGWQQYVRFALYVVGISGGVRIYDLQRYIEPDQVGREGVMVSPPPLTAERWVLEVYRTIIESLQALAWVLLVFFVFALLAFVIVRIGEMRRERPVAKEGP